MINENFKTDFKFHDYLTVQPYIVRSALIRFRSSNHLLQKEIVSHNGKARGEQHACGEVAAR